MANYLSESQSRENREARRELSYEQFAQAERLANANGMGLRQCSLIQFQLLYGDGWILNIYPSNQRLYHDPHHKGPFLKIEAQPWTLIDVVRSAIDHMKGDCHG